MLNCRRTFEAYYGLKSLGLGDFGSPAGRVSRSYSLKAKISENVGIFVLALKRKKVVNFALFA
jgi:hypothetical protein